MVELAVDFLLAEADKVSLQDDHDLSSGRSLSTLFKRSSSLNPLGQSKPNLPQWGIPIFAPKHRLWVHIHWGILIFAPKHRLWVHVRIASSKNKKNIKKNSDEIFYFYSRKNLYILHGQVFVMGKIAYKCVTAVFVMGKNSL